MGPQHEYAHPSMAAQLGYEEERDVAHGAMGHRINPSWGGPIELFLVPASAPVWDGAYKRTLAVNR